MKKIIKTVYKYILPPILRTRTLREIYKSIFQKKYIKHHFEFENNFFNRHAFINKAISKFENCKYLEIGVANNEVFNTIPLKIENKFGVDPDSGGNFRMTSDEFFKEHSNLKFDVIFIDGLHIYEQCQKDCINSMKQLKENGIIFFHDFLPRSFFEEKVPRKQSTWSGDVWKVAVELANSRNVEFKIINIDHGVGVLKLKKNFEYKKMEELKNMGFVDYLNYRKSLPIVNSDIGLDFITEF